MLANALQGGKQLTRDELASALQQAGIATEGEQRVTHIMMRAELDGIICSGARRGKQGIGELLASPRATRQDVSSLCLWIPLAGGIARSDVLCLEDRRYQRTQSSMRSASTFAYTRKLITQYVDLE